MQEIYQCYSGPTFISGEIHRAKGEPPVVHNHRVKPYRPYQKDPKPSWPYDTLTMPHEAGLILEHEKFELLYLSEVHDTAAEVGHGHFEEHHAHRPLIEPCNVDINTKLPNSESFYCTGKGCMFCKPKTPVEVKK